MKAKEWRELSMDELKQKVLNCFIGASTASGARVEYKWDDVYYAPVRNNLSLARLFKRNMESLGRKVRLSDPNQGTGSTDMGNVSQLVPSIHANVAIAEKIASHSPEFALAAASGLLYPANSTSMARTCPPEITTKGFALNRLANNIGATIGPAVGGFLALRNYGLLFWVDGLTCLAAVILFSLIWKKPEQHLRDRAQDKIQSSRSPWRDAPFLWLLPLVVVWGCIFFQLFATFPLYMREVYGLAENRIGQLIMINTLLIVSLEMLLIHWIAKRSLTRFIAVSFLLTGLGFALMPFGRGFLYAALTVAVWTFGEMLSMPLLGSLIASRADPGSMGRYMGLFSFAFSLSMIVGPVIGTSVYGRLGPTALWLGCGVTGCILYAAFSLLSRPLVAEQNKG